MVTAQTQEASASQDFRSPGFVVFNINVRYLSNEVNLPIFSQLLNSLYLPGISLLTHSSISYIISTAEITFQTSSYENIWLVKCVIQVHAEKQSQGPNCIYLITFLETLHLLRMVSMDGTKCADSLRWSKIRNTLASTVVLRSTQDVSLDLFTRRNDLKI